MKEKKIFSYKWICINGKSILEHRHIMDKILGRKLSYNEIVHHANDNKRDNEPKNLRLKQRSEHSREFILKTKPRVPIKCKNCNKIIFKTKAEIRYKRDNLGYNIFCSRPCMYLYRKKD